MQKQYGRGTRSWSWQWPCQWRLALLLLATVALFGLELHLAAVSDYTLTKVYFLPYIMGIAWLTTGPLAVLGAVLWVLAALSKSLGADVVGSNATWQLGVETAAIVLCLWVFLLKVEAQEAITVERDQLRQNLRSSLLSATLIHEIKQPLTALLLQCRLLKSQQEQEPDHVQTTCSKLRRQFAAVLNSAEQLQESVDAVTAVLRGGSRSPSQPIDLGRLIGRCLAAQAERLAALELSVQQQGFEQPLLIWVEERPLQILVDNLLRNAFDALESCEAGQRRLTLALRRRPPNLQLTVSDSGPGLPDGTLDGLELRSSKPSGLGLGLFTAATIASQHGGNLQAGRSSQLGGAALCLTLPLNRDPGKVDNGAEPPDAPVQSR